MAMIAVSACIALVLSGLGLRILRQASQGGGLPDRMVGLFFLCLGVGGPPGLLANDPGIVPRDLAPISLALGHLVLSIGFAGLFVFVWRCFGADSSWRRALALTAIVALAGLWAAQGLVDRFALVGGPILKLTAIVRATALLWAFCETVRYRGMLRKRATLGLADPVVSNRFGLWCLWMGSMLAAVALVITIRFALPGFGPGTHPPLRLAVVAAFFALTSMGSLGLYLAFFPPDWYLARIRGAAAA